MPEVVDRLVIDVSSSLTALHLVIHGHYQVFDPVLKHFIIVSLGFWFIIGAPVVDFRGKPFFLELFSQALSMSLWNAVSHISLVQPYFSVADPGEGPGYLGPPLFSDQTEARRAEKTFLETGPPLISKSIRHCFFPCSETGNRYYNNNYNF